MTTVLPTDVVVQGAFSAQSMVLPAGAVTNASVAAAAAIAASKLQQPVRKMLADPSATTATSYSKPIHLVLGATTTVNKISAGCVTPCIGTDTISVDVKKNGTTILSAPIALSSAQSARQAVAAAITVPAGVAGDVYEVVIAVTHSTGTMGVGLFIEFQAYEDAP